MRSVVLDCLRMTQPSADLEFPADAWAHFEDIERALAPWQPNSSLPIPDGRTWQTGTVYGYSGPWIEQVWIAHGKAKWAESASHAERRRAFGGAIPLFVPWVDWHLRGRIQPGSSSKVTRITYPEGLVSTITSILRPSVPYVTVSWSDYGIPGQPLDSMPMARIPNVLVFSAGGYGHVPIPLLKQPEERLPPVPMAERPNLVSFVGT